MTAFSLDVNLTGKIKMSKSKRRINESNSMFETLRIERTKLNQEQFLEAVGIPHKTWRRWITGETEGRLTLKQIKAICKILNLSVDDLPDNFAEKH